MHVPCSTCRAHVKQTGRWKTVFHQSTSWLKHVLIFSKWFSRTQPKTLRFIWRQWLVVMHMHIIITWQNLKWRSNPKLLVHFNSTPDEQKRGSPLFSSLLLWFMLDCRITSLVIYYVHKEITTWRFLGLTQLGKRCGVQITNSPWNNVTRLWT